MKKTWMFAFFLCACGPYKGKTTRSAEQWTALLEQAISARQLQLHQCFRYLPAEIDRAEVTVQLSEDPDAHSEHELQLRARNDGTRELDSCTRDALDVLRLPNSDDSHRVGGQWSIVYDRNQAFVLTPNQTEPLRDE